MSGPGEKLVNAITECGWDAREELSDDNRVVISIYPQDADELAENIKQFIG